MEPDTQHASTVPATSHSPRTAATPVRSSSDAGTAHLVLVLSCPDRPGIVRAVSGLLADHGGNITESRQFGEQGAVDAGCAPAQGRFFMRVQVQTSTPRDVLEAALAELAQDLNMDWHLDEVGRPVRTVLMVSKDGHCLTDLLFRRQSQGLPIEPVAVVGNHRDLEPIADFYGVPFHHIPVTKDTKAQAEAALLELVAQVEAELVVLARYMQILSDELCTTLAERGVPAINIHHSFLPSFKGARPYAQAHTRGVKLIGATAHYVTADLDEGPIIEQDVERVTHNHSVEELVGMGQDVERRVLARAVRWQAEHRVLASGRRTVVFV